VNVQLPFDAVSVEPAVGAPAIVGGTLFARAVAIRAGEAAGSATARTNNASSSGDLLIDPGGLYRGNACDPDRKTPTSRLIPYTGPRIRQVDQRAEGFRVRTTLSQKVMCVVVPAVVIAGVAIAVASASGITAIKVSSALGSKIVVTANGLTLYHDAAEKKGSIACAGACAKVWLPLIAGSSVKLRAGPGLNAAKLGTIKRPDGSLQITYNGLALYRYASDKAAGQTKGQGLKGTWFAVTPAGAVTKASPAGSTAGGTSSGGSASSGGTSSGGATTGPLPTVTCDPNVVVTDPNNPCYNTAH
jgi:predicted lipoprotein with Yx(FWY)xxD motif